VTSYERLQNAVTAVGNKRAVVGMWLIFGLIVGHEPVVKRRSVSTWIEGGRFLCWHHLPQVPKFHRLVFSIAEHVSTVAFAIDVRQTLCMAHEDSGFSAVAHATSIPYFYGRVVRA